jgi:hypothetical protein
MSIDDCVNTFSGVSAEGGNNVVACRVMGFGFKNSSGGKEEFANINIEYDPGGALSFELIINGTVAISYDGIRSAILDSANVSFCVKSRIRCSD